MLLIRRLPSLLYHYRHIAIGLFLTVFIFVNILYFLLDWGVVCTNIQASRHVAKVVNAPALKRDLSHEVAVSRLTEKSKLTHLRQTTLLPYLSF